MKLQYTFRFNILGLSNMRALFFLLLIILPFAFTQALATTISTTSLLKEMIDRDKIASFPTDDFRLKQHSSYNQISTTPEDKETWFANSDYTTPRASGLDDSKFIRLETNAQGEKEWVLMDHQGPGALVRVWMPEDHLKGSTVRLYFDGETTPRVERDLATFFNGDGEVPYPLAHKSLFSAVSFFPLPYAKGLKITVSKKPFFFQYTFREYTDTANIKTFELSDFESNKALIKEVGETLLHPKNTTKGKKVSFAAKLNKNQQQSVALPKGNAAIRTLNVKLADYLSDPEVTRKVILKIEFDGKETVWTPIGDFFGTGIGLNPHQGWDKTVSEDGTLSTRWVMPYQTSGEISLVNLSDKPVDVQLNAVIGDWQWDKQSLYFNSAWHGQYPVATVPHSDWNYVTLKGRGVYVSDTLTIMNPVAGWWGEGDEKIWVDGEDFPSLFGTGTEDYYGYSWGGKANDFYEHPFHAQPRSYLYNKLNRKPESEFVERNTAGYSTEVRSRSLDTMPFSSSLQLDMEVWSKSDVDMGYGVGMSWYGDANTRSNRVADIKEVLNVPPLPNPLPPTPAGKKKKK